MQRARIVSPVAVKDQDSLKTTSCNNKNEKHVGAMGAEGGRQGKRKSQTYSIKSRIYKRELQDTLKIRMMKQVRHHRL